MPIDPEFPKNHKTVEKTFRLSDGDYTHWFGGQEESDAEILLLYKDVQDAYKIQ